MSTYKITPKTTGLETYNECIQLAAMLTTCGYPSRVTWFNPIATPPEHFPDKDLWRAAIHVIKKIKAESDF